MFPFLRIGRRQFLRQSAMGLAGAPLLAGIPAAPPAMPQSKTPRTATESTALTMRAAFDSKSPIWIVREPQSGFQQQWAARELARGLRALGLARDLVVASAGQGQPPAGSIVFSLSTSRQSIRNPE